MSSAQVKRLDPSECEDLIRASATRPRRSSPSTNFATDCAKPMSKPGPTAMTPWCSDRPVRAMN